MEYLNTDISLLPPAPFQIQPTSAAQNISYSLHRNTNRYISFFYWKHLFMFPFIISTTGHEKPLSQLSPAFCHPASLKSMYGHVECTINAIFKDFTFFFHTCIMCLCKLGFPMYYTVIYCLKFRRPPTGFSCGYLFG